MGWIIVFPAWFVVNLLHGFDFVVAWVLGLLAEAGAILSLLGGWVYLTRTRATAPLTPQKRTATVSVLLLSNFLLAFVLVGYLKEMQPPLAVPMKLVPGEIKSAKRKLPHGTPVDFDHLTFARGKLYVASGIGLVEVDGTKVSAVYRWHEHSRIDGVWSGPKKQSLWLQQAVSSDLILLDGSGWKNIALPTPDRGYTRGDMLSGIKIASNDSDLWLSGGSTLWKWNADKSVWEIALVPNMHSGYESVEVHGNSELPVVLRGANPLFGSGDGAVLLKRTANGGWIETKLDECCVKDLITLGDRIYFRNKNGALIRIENGKSETISTPGRVEAIGSENGKLFVSIADVGIFSFGTEWIKLFDAPYPPGLEKTWVHLAVLDGVVALSVAQSSSSNAGIRKDGLWISEGSKLRKIELPD